AGACARRLCPPPGPPPPPRRGSPPHAPGRHRAAARRRRSETASRNTGRTLRSDLASIFPPPGRRRRACPRNAANHRLAIALSGVEGVVAGSPGVLSGRQRAGPGKLATPRPRTAAGPTGRPVAVPDRSRLSSSAVAGGAGGVAKTGRPAAGFRVGAAAARPASRPGQPRSIAAGVPFGRRPAAGPAAAGPAPGLPLGGVLLLDGDPGRRPRGRTRL